jgi:hypothetical protein
LFKYGTYTFLPRDLQTLELNGVDIIEEDGDVTTPLSAPSFPSMTIFTCDFYQGRESEVIEPIHEGADLYHKVKHHLTPKLNIGEEIELIVHNNKSGVRKAAEPFKIEVIIRALNSGMFYHGVERVYKTQDKVGWVELQVIRNPLPYPPIVYKIPLRVKKRPREEEDSFILSKSKTLPI